MFRTCRGGGLGSNSQGFTQSFPQGGVGGAQTGSASQVISSGTGDIVLSSGNGEKKRSWKRWGIIGGIAAVVVLVVALLAVGVGRQSGSGGMRASNVREAFNLYANYFLTGETSKEDIDVPESDDEDVLGLEVDDGTEYLVRDSDTEDYTEEDDETVAIEEVEVVEEVIDETREGMDATEVGASAYFDDFIGVRGEEADEYLVRLWEYFEQFQEFYDMEVDASEEAAELINEYAVWLNLATVYYSEDGLSQLTILDAYNEGGVEGAEKLINEEASRYSGLENVNEEDFGTLLSNYGRQELRLIVLYDGYGCVNDGEIDYGCVAERFTEEDEIAMDAKSEYSLAIENIVGNVVDNLQMNLYTLRDLAYVEVE